MNARQSTARTYIVGPVLDADGVAVTGGVVADFKCSKNGAAPGALDGSATLTHRHTGHYSLALTANDLDTVGTAQITIDDTVNACPPLNIQVVEEVVYDDFYKAAATGCRNIDSVATVTGNVNGNVGGSVGSVVAGVTLAADAITSTALAASAVTEIQSGLATAAALDAVDNFLDTEIADIQARLPAALVGGRIDATVDGTGMEAAASAAIADAVWDEILSGHVGAGSTGEALSAAGGAGDPWITALPGAYGAGSAGKIVGDSLNATVGSRASQSSVDDLPTNAELATALWTADDAVMARLGAPAGASIAADIATKASQTSVDDLPTNAELSTALGTADDAMLAQVALVKAKTDLIPASPAAVGSAMTLTSGERDAIAAALLDLASGVETGKTVRQALRLMAAAVAGKRSNSGTLTEQFDAIGNPGTARIVSNADAAGDGTPTITP